MLQIQEISMILDTTCMIIYDVSSYCQVANSLSCEYVKLVQYRKNLPMRKSPSTVKFLVLQKEWTSIYIYLCLALTLFCDKKRQTDTVIAFLKLEK